jgi:cyclophilin family peptidyl-prolyl cis-trans isomerase
MRNVLVVAVLLGAVPVAAQTRPAARPRPGGAPAAAAVAAGTEAVVETAKGSFTIRLLPDIAPKHAALFVKTAKAGGYDGTTFHRIVAGGIVQGGDPLSKDPARSKLYGTGGLGLLKAEITGGEFKRGIVAAARKPSGLNTGGSQFFVVVTDQPALKSQYTIFGEVTSGMEVVDKISLTPVSGDRPLARVEIRSVTVRPAP